ncbi:hypothetical protein FB468_1097 [Leucobacter komagatae]|uniref:Uncharacterized protein n=1 Tax=Leucobacter komagatae TaxID=55969 RepID=A0A542Y4T5_9MICO|nr:hypothetical protein [Leucobacter komagatae]TQL43082.1 hypothetical protein FB468_1097 [Leucobacter komagatae]
MPNSTAQRPPRSLQRERNWWIAVCATTLLVYVLSAIALFKVPLGSQLGLNLARVHGGLTGIEILVILIFFMWFAGSRRVQPILAEDPHAPVALVGGLAEDSNEILAALGASHSFPKPERVLISFGATAEGLHVYRRFGHRIAFLPADRIDDIRLERRALATGPEREVVSFIIRDDADTSHRLSLAMFSTGKLCLLSYSQTYMKSILTEFREKLGLEARGG